jgi:RNA polymerase sigma factor (sigma-70 family)
MDIHRSPEGFKGESSEFTWLYRVTVNHGCSFLRKRYRQRERMEYLTEEPVDGRGDHAAAATHAVDLQKIFSSIDPKTQQILFLLAIEGLTQEEVASVTGISRRALNKRLAKQHANFGTYFEGRAACLIILWLMLVCTRHDFFLTN